MADPHVTGCNAQCKPKVTDRTCPECGLPLYEHLVWHNDRGHVFTDREIRPHDIKECVRNLAAMIREIQWEK